MRRFTLIAFATLAGCALSAGCRTDKAKQDKTKAIEDSGTERPARDPCPTPPFILDVAAKVEGRENPQSFHLPKLEVVDAVAVRLLSGSAFTFFIADYQIDRSDLGRTTLHPPAGHILITAMITPDSRLKESRTPVTTGQVIPTVREDPPPDPLEGKPPGTVLRLIMERGEEMYNLGQGASGQVVILHEDNEHICIDIDYRDSQEKRVVGAVRMQIVEP